MEEVLFEESKKVPTWESFCAHRKSQRFLAVYVDNIKMALESSNVGLTWKNHRKDTGVEDLTYVRNQKNSSCTERGAEVVS